MQKNYQEKIKSYEEKLKTQRKEKNRKIIDLKDELEELETNKVFIVKKLNLYHKK